MKANSGCGSCTCHEDCHENRPESYVRSTSEEARLRSLSLFLIRSIVENHGGTMDIDLATNTIKIDVPNEEEVACAKEIEEQIGSMCC